MNFLPNLHGIGRSLKTFLVHLGLNGWMAVTATLDATTLPDDPAFLKSLLEEYAQTLGERERYIDRLQQSLVKLRRWQFGTKSEVVPDGQIIFPFLGTLEPEKPQVALEEPIEPHQRRTPPLTTRHRRSSKSIHWRSRPYSRELCASAMRRGQAAHHSRNGQRCTHT